MWVLLVFKKFFKFFTPKWRGGPRRLASVLNVWRWKGYVGIVVRVFFGPGRGVWLIVLAILGFWPAIGSVDKCWTLGKIAAGRFPDPVAVR